MSVMLIFFVTKYLIVPTISLSFTNVFPQNSRIYVKESDKSTVVGPD